ncbi:MAG: [protein-PII] uridylyltransferase [Desulfobacterales bacterium]
MNTVEHFAAEQLKTNREELIRSFLKGRTASFMERHARLIDDYFQNSFAGSLVGPRMDITANPYAIIALGGYGRTDQCVHSDVDLLILFEKRVPDSAERLIQEIIYPLWDIGMDVGHATRSLKDCTVLAGRDFEALTPLLDARFVCGISSLYIRLMDQIQEKVVQRRGKKIVDWLVAANMDRHVRFGDSTYLLEPNLKEGVGGLRDYHTLLWIAKLKSKIKDPRDLEYYGYLSHEEFRSLSSALEFIFKVRNHLHLLNGRKYDQLHFENQLRLAERLGYRATGGQQPVERFLGDLHRHMEFIKQLHLMFLFEQGYEKNIRRHKRRSRVAKVEGIEVVRDALNFTSSNLIPRRPELLVRIFEESARLKLPLSAEASRIVKEFRHLINSRQRNTPTVVRSFEKILMSPAPTFNVLNAMLNTGLLERILPQFGEVVDRIQYDEYHLYPVDRHLLRTVRTLKAFTGEENDEADRLAVQLFGEIRQRKLLLWAALLHDIGKGAPGGNHSEIGARMAHSLLEEKGYGPVEVETVAFLVREHLLLAKTATRRDINDEETAISLARTVRDVERLKMLYLLTVADSMATGPKAHNSWTSTLFKNLFFKALNILERGELASGEAMASVDQKRDALLATARTEDELRELDNLFKVMSPRYLLNVPVDDILGHIRLFRSKGDASFVWDVTASADAETRIVTICAQDRPGLFSQIAGIFTLNRINVLDAQVFTWRNNIALDVFKVTPPPDIIFEAERWERAETQLTEALRGRFALREKLDRQLGLGRSMAPSLMGRPQHVQIDNTSSSFFTIIEIYTYDFPGLLFSLTDALFRCRLDVWVAKIATNVDQVVDVFYVRDFDGQKVDSPEHVERIRQAVLEALPDQSNANGHGRTG